MDLGSMSAAQDSAAFIKPILYGIGGTNPTEIFTVYGFLKF